MRPGSFRKRPWPGASRSAAPIAAGLGSLLAGHPHRQPECPDCSYKPPALTLWPCTPPCDGLTNLLETGGFCSGCGLTHRTVRCPECAQHSPVLMWFAPLYEVRQ